MEVIQGFTYVNHDYICIWCVSIFMKTRIPGYSPTEERTSLIGFIIQVSQTTGLINFLK